MPKRTPADDQLIYALYQETHSGREVARQLHLHENTIYNALRRHRGACPLCGVPVAPGKKHCATCLEILRKRMQTKRKKRIRQGLCIECNKRVVAPSRRYCTQHRLRTIEHQATYAAKHHEKRGAPHAGILSQRQRERGLRDRYGEAGIIAWQRDGGQCVLCRVSFTQRAIHMHHINGIHAQSTEDNMVCLCFNCHKLIHLMMGHPDLSQVLTWFQNHCSIQQPVMPHGAG